MPRVSLLHLLTGTALICLICVIAGSAAALVALLLMLVPAYLVFWLAAYLVFARL